MIPLLAIGLLATPLPPALGPALPGAMSMAEKRAELNARAQALDARGHHSRHPEWRAIMGWRRIGDTWLTWSSTADETSSARFPHPEGRRDPAADFAASVASAWLDPAFGCRFPLRADALARMGLGPSPTAIERGACPGFLEWARPDLIEGLELVFATPSWAEPATTAGHVLLRARARADTAELVPATEPVWSYGVDMTRPEAARHRFVRGLIGDLRGEVLTETGHALDWRYGTLDRRDLYIYGLELDDRERRLLLARLWVQVRDESHAGYAFFSLNCARLTHDTLRSIMPDLPRTPGWFMHPHQVVGELVRSGRATPRGVIWSRRSRARLAERERDAVAPALDGVPGFRAAHDARHDPDRAHRFTEVGLPVDPAARAALATWADATLDIEVYAVDAEAGPGPEMTSAPMEAALAMRARLPATPSARLAPFPRYAVIPGGSSRMTISGGYDGARAVTRLRVGVVDEQPGEARAIALRRSSRFEFLVSEITLGWPAPDWPQVADSRLILLSTIDHGTHVRTVDGWWGSRLDLLVDTGLHSAPARGRPFGGWLRVGQGLTLLATDDDTGFAVIGVDLRGVAQMGGEAARGEAGVWLEVIAPFGGAAHHLRVQARLAPGIGTDRSAIESEASARLDLLASRRHGVFLGPFARWTRGGLRGDGWEVGAGVGF